MSKMKRYLVSYRHDGVQWNIELPASNVDDANRRLGQLVFARMEGEIVAKVPASLSPLIAIAAWTRNLVRRVGSAA